MHDLLSDQREGFRRCCNDGGVNPSFLQQSSECRANGRFVLDRENAAQECLITRHRWRRFRHRDTGSTARNLNEKPCRPANWPRSLQLPPRRRQATGPRNRERSIAPKPHLPQARIRRHRRSAPATRGSARRQNRPVARRRSFSSDAFGNGHNTGIGRQLVSNRKKGAMMRHAT